MSESDCFTTAPLSEQTLKGIVAGKLSAYGFEARSMARELLELRKKAQSQSQPDLIDWSSLSP